MSLKNTILLIAILVSTIALSQETVVSTDSVPPGSTNTADRLYRPQLEIGTGVLNYFGDIGHLGGTGRSYDLNWGYNLSVKNKISPSFDLNLFFLMGNISQTEHFKNGNANFKTDIKMTGISAVYTFETILPKKRYITPYISLGITSFEFNPKGDLYDADGNKYHYWSDGTTRKGSPTLAKGDASDVIGRDYVYETDLRRQDEKNRYEQRSFSMPVGVGAFLHLTDAFTLRLGTEFHYTLTDNLDNLNSENTTYKSSKKGNDYLLYSGLGIAYNLHYFKKDRSKIIDEGLFDLQDIEFEDEDNDGIADIVDLCPFTPLGVEVDIYGCPVDSDKDGVPDYLDLEPNSAPNAFVDENGVTLTDDRIEKMYLAFKDSVGDMQLQKSTTTTADITAKRRGNENYRLVISNTKNFNNEEISKLLSIHDLKIENINGELSYYIGDFNNLESALQRSLEIKTLDIQTDIIKVSTGKSLGMDDHLLRQLETAITFDQRDIDFPIFRVQIGAFRNKLSDQIFSNLPDLVVIEGEDGLTRYSSGSYLDMKEAATHKIDLLLNGFDGAFVVAYKSGKRITLHEAGATLTDPGKQESLKPEPKSMPSVNPKLVTFSVQIGSFSGRIPAEILGEYLELGNVRPIRMATGESKYIYGKFETSQEAENALSTLKAKGFGDAFIVGEFNNQVIPEEEAVRLKNQ